MYKRYRKQYNRHKAPNLLEMLIDIFFGFVYFLAVVVYKLIKLIFNRYKQKKVYKLSEFRQEPRVNEEVNSRYELKEGGLLTPAEKNFLEVLKQIVGNAYQIEYQVQLSRIVTPIDSNNNYINYKDLNQIDRKSIDFVLFDYKYKPYLAIELDDKSHHPIKRIKRDLFVDGVMKGVGLRILHVQVAYSYDIDQLRRDIFNNSDIIIK